MPEEWPAPPWKTKNANGKFMNPFVETTKFTEELVKNGMLPLSDEIVLMSYLYHNGLSLDQDERRAQCNEFMASIRKDIETGNVAGVGAKLRKFITAKCNVLNFEVKVDKRLAIFL
jgi:hypothetical protein